LVAWLSCIPLLEFASHAVSARMSFSSVWVSVPASTLEWAHRFSGKGWWLAQHKNQHQHEQHKQHKYIKITVFLV
jgi:hypothetical protein